MKKLYRGRLLISTCLTGAALGLAPGALAQTSDSTWKPRADVEAEAGERGSQVSVELFAPLAQNDSNLLFVTGRVGTDEDHDRNGSVTVGGRGRIGNDVAIGVNAGVDFYRSPLTSRAQTAASFGIEGFTSVFDVRLNYRMPLNNKRAFGFQDPNASPIGVLSIANNRLIETKAGFRIDEIPLSGVNGEVGARASLSKNFSLRGSFGAFDYRDDAAARGYRGIRGGVELDIDNPVGEGSRFSLGARLDDDNRFGTHARAMARLSIPFGGGSRRDRSTSTTGLDRQMGDRIRRDYTTEAGSRYTDLTSTSFATDDRTGQAFGGIYYTNGTAVAGGAGTAANPTAIGDAVTRAGANGVVVALGNAGNISTGGVTLAANQYLLGGASSVAVRHTNGAVTQFGFGGTNGTILGTNAAGAAVTLGQGSVVRDVTIRGAGTGVAANGVGGFGLERLVIENTGGAGLSLTNTLGAVVVDGITIRGGAGAGVLVNGGSNITLRNSTIGGGAGAIDINDGGATLTTTLSNLTLSATGGNVLDIDGSGAGTVTVAGLSGITIAGGNGETGGFAARSVAFDSSATAGIQTVNAGRMEVGTNAARVNGAGLSLTDITGALSFTDLDISNNGGTGLTVTNLKTNDFTLTTLDGTVDTTAGTALNLDPLNLNLTFASVSSTGATGAGIILDEVTGVGTGGNALTIGTLNITDAGAQGLFITGGSTGLVTITGGSIVNSGGASVQIGEAGVAGSGGTIGLNFGASITDGGAGPLVSLFNIGGTIRFTGAITGAGPILVDGSTAGSSITFAGATTLNGSASPAVSITNLLGSFNFSGPLTISNPVGDGIVLGIITGGVTFGDVDITGLGGGTGLDLTGTQGNVTFRTLDISGTGVAGSTGIDLTGATNPGNMLITDPSHIQGVDIGVDLTNASITGTFRFGDGNSSDGLESSITANTPIVATGLDTTHGTYDFADVILTGNTNNLTGGSFTAYYVQAGAVGDGSSSSNPGTLAGAEASGAQYIVLLNDPAGGTDVLDATTAGGSLDLIAGQTLVSFLYTDFFSVTGATVPANLIVSGLGPTGILNPYTGSGAATLTTTTAGVATVNLSSGSRLDGLVIQNGGTGVGVSGTGLTSTTIVNSNISGNGGAIAITDGGAASTATLDNLNLGASGGTVLSLSGAGAGTLSVSGSGITIAATGTAGAVNIGDVAAGNLTLGTITTGTSLGTAVQVSGLTGTLTTGNITVGGSGADGVSLAGNSGTIALGTVTTSGVTGAGLRIGNTSGTVTVAGATINGGLTGGVVIQGVTGTGSVTIGPVSASGAGGAGIVVNDVNGTAAFTGITAIANRAGIVLGAGSAGAITFGDVDITGLTANTTGVDARNASGTVTFNTLDISGASAVGTRGIDLTGATFAGSVSTTDSGTITGVGVGVDLTNAAITGSFRYGDGSNTDADGAASIINAVTPIAVGGINAGVGTYDFRDVNLTGDTSGLASSASLFWVRAGASGAGTRSDPGSIGGAEASGANIVILLNDPAGGNDTIDANEAVLGAGGTFDMLAGQQLLGFLNGDTLIVPGGAPANVLVYGISPGLLVNPFAGSGAPTLTTTAAGGVSTVTVASNVVLDGLIIANPGGAGVGGAGAANVTIRNSQISGAGGAINLSSGAGTASAALSNLLLWSSGNSVALAVNDSTAGTMTVTQLSNITIEGGHGEGAGTDFFNTIFDADLATTGAQTVDASIQIGTAATRVNGYALGLNGSSGALNFTALSVYNSGSSGLVGTMPALNLSSTGGTIDTINGNTISLASTNIDLVLDRVAHAGTGSAVLMTGVTGIGTGGRALDVTDLAVTAGANAIAINGASSGNFNFGAASSISGTTGVAISLANTAGALNFTYDGSVTQAANAALLNVATHTGTVTFGAGSSLTASNGAGLQFNNADGVYNFNGTTTLNGGDAAIDIFGGSAGTFTFGAGTSIASPAGNAFDVRNSNAAITYSGSIAQASNALLLFIQNDTGSANFTGATLSASGGAGLQFENADGIYQFGSFALSGGSRIAVTTASAGAFTFSDIDITGLAANTTAVDLRGATGNVTFATLDITGASTVGTRGIDLTGSTTAANIIVSDSSTITGVGIGVDLTNAAITGTFRYGDGSNTDADGAASFINATIPVVVTGLNAGVGTYDFRDVNLVGDTSGLASNATMYWVRQGASGAGTRSDPGSIGGAEASGANIIILLNDPTGGNDTIDANEAVLGAGGTLELVAGQQLLGFLNTDTLNVPGGAPANVLIFGITPGVVTNPFAGSGAPMLTTTAGGGADTVRLANNVLIDGVVIANGGTGSGIFSLAPGISAINATIRNSQISGADGAINLNGGAGGPVTGGFALSNLLLWSSNNTAALIVHSPVPSLVTITELSNITIEGGHGGSGGASFLGAIFDADLGTAGRQAVNASLQIGTSATRVNGTGLSLTFSSGALNLSSPSVYNSGGAGLANTSTGLDLTSATGAIDTINGDTISLANARIDLVLGNVTHAGTGSGLVGTGVTGIGAGGRATDIGNLTVTGGTNAISISGASPGNYTFGAASSISGTTGTAIALGNTSGTLNFTYDGSVTQAANAALLNVTGHIGTVTFGVGSTLAATNGAGLSFDNADGSYAFSGTTTLNGGDAGIDIVNGSGGSFTFGANTSVSSPTGTAFEISNSTAAVTYSGNLTQANNSALISVTNHSTGTLTFNTGTLSATNGSGVSFNNADGLYEFNGTTTLNGGDAALDITNGSAGTFTFGANTSITSPIGTAINIAASTANVTYSGSATQANSAILLNVFNHSGGTLTFDTGTLSASDGTGMNFVDADGTYNFNGTATLSGGAYLQIIGGSAGNFTFGANTSVISPFLAAVSIQSSTASLSYLGNVTIGLAQAAVQVQDHTAGTISFVGSTLNVTNGPGLTFNNADGTYQFGSFALSGGAGIAITNGSAGTFTFGDVDITGLAANTTAVNLTGATGSVTFQTLDITGASLVGTTGIDLTGNSTAGNIIVNESSNISGVAVGINLTNAALTGNFRYGDGSNTDGDGAASNITATTPLLITGLNGATGTYNFADVNLIGDTSNLSVSAYFVLDGATGTGTRSDPGSLSGAEAASATYIVLLNNPNGGNDTIDATGAGGSLDLDGGQFLYSFRDTDSFVVGGGAPANVTLFNVQTGVIDNPYAGSGAPTLTAGGAASTVVLNGANVIDGVVITNGGTGAGISGSGATNVTIRNSTISGGAGGAINIADGGAATILSLSNLNLAAADGNILNLAGTGGGTLTITGFSGLTATHTTETSGFVFEGVAFDSDAVTGGYQALSAGALTLGTTGARISGDGLRFDNVVGVLNFTDLNIANNVGTGLLVQNPKANDFLLTTTGGNIDTTGGIAINLDPLTINMILNTVTATGGSYGILLNTVEGAFTVTGAVSIANATIGIAVQNNTAQTDALDVNFQGAVTTTGSSLWGVYFNNNNGATANFTGGVNITAAAGTGFEVGGGGTVTVTGSANSINSAGSGMTLQDTTVGAAGITFNGITASGGTALFLNAVNLTGAVNIVGLTSTYSGLGAGATFNGITGTGGVNLTGTIDIDDGLLNFAGDLGIINIANVAGSSLTIDGASEAVNFNGVNSGTVNIASAAGTASIGSSASSINAAISATADTGGTLNYGGTIGAATGSVLNVTSGSVATINLSGAITSTSGVTAFNFNDADGTYNISGSVSHTGGTGLYADAASSGNINFTGASTAFNAANGGTAVAMAGTGTLAFTGGALDIDATSGSGLAANGGGTLIVTGAGNTITTANGEILNLNGITAGAGGINFASLTTTGTVTSTAISINNLDGTSFNGGTVNIAGTSGGASDGIFIGGGSAATIGFGATTIAATGGDGIEINGAGNGAITFSSVTINNTGGAGVNILNSNGTVTISGGAIGGANDPTGAGVLVDGGSGAVTINADVTKTTAGNVVSVVNRTGGSVSFGGALSTTGAGDGILVANNTGGTVTFAGAVTVNSAGAFGVFLDANAGSTINFTGGVNVVNSSSGFLAQGGGTVTVTGTNALTGTGVAALYLNGITVGAAGISFGSVTKIGGTNGVLITNVASSGGGAISLGTVNLQNVTTRGVDVAGALGAALTINDLDVSLNNAGAVAFDLNGTTLNAAIAVNDFDVTSTTATGTIGVDLRGTLGGQTVRLGDTNAAGASSSIAGVGTGVYLNATTNATFTFGDGEAVTDTGSTISAVTAINATNAPAAGTYDFRDVAFAGSPGLGFGIGSIYFVDSNGSTGGGNGSGSDGANPGTLANAETLATGSTDIIVLINNGNAISAAGSNGNDTLALNPGVQVRGFGNGVGGGAGSGSAPIAINIVVPSTILLSGGTTLNIADPTGNGAATLTSAAGADVITLGAAPTIGNPGNRISGFILDGSPAGALHGINDNGSGATRTTINFMTIRNFNAVNGYGIEITPSTTTTIDNVVFSGNTNDVLVNALDTTISNVTSTGATGTSITIRNASGTTLLTNVNISGAGTGLFFDNAGGTINAASVNITGGSTSALTVSGGTASFNFDAASSITQATAGIAVNITGNHTVGTFAYAGTINATSGTGLQFNNADATYNFTGTTTLNGGSAGIDIFNDSTGTFSFGTGTSITNPLGSAFDLNNSNANVTYSGSITSGTFSAVAISNHDAGTITFQTGAITHNGSGTGIAVLNSNGGTVNFLGQTSLTATDTGNGVELGSNDGGTVNFNAAGNGLDIVTSNGNGLYVYGGGTLNVLGSNNSIVTGSGVIMDISNTGATATTLNLNFASASNATGTGNGISITRSAGTLTGSVNIVGGAITAANRAISLDGGTFDFSYGGSLATSGASARSLFIGNRTGGTVTLSGNITDSSAGIAISGNTGGTINLTGQSIALTTGTFNALSLNSNAGATINIAPAAGGNGLDIVTTSGTGITASGGGTIIITGTGNSIQTATGVIADLSGISAGTGGINFATLSSTGTVGATAINFSNLDGTSFTVTGTTTIAGTSGATSDGIFIGGNSAAAFSFGATTISNTGDEGIEVNGAGNGTVTFGSVTIDNTDGNGVEINSSDNAVTINGGAIGAANDPTGRGVYIVNGTGAVTIAASITKTTAGNVVGISAHFIGALNFSGNISATGGFDNGIAINAGGDTINFTGQTINLSTGAFTGLSITGPVAGAAYNFTPVFGGTGLDITTTTGTGMSLTGSSGSASYTVGGSGNSITTGSGTILNIANALAGPMTLNMAFASASNTSGANGILIDRTGAGAITGTLNISSGAITATTRGVDLNGETLNFTYGGTISASGTGRSIEVTGHSAGTATFSGAITDTGAGINLSSNLGGTITISGTINAIGAGTTGALTIGSNAGGTINLSGATKRFNTGSSTAVNLTNNTGATINFSSGGLNITSTSANGFNATGGGTINVSGGSNIISTGSGVAINVANTNIGATGLTFQSVSANGGSRGIILNTTGSAGGLTITGTGTTDGSGGTIQNITTRGIELLNTALVSIANVNLTNANTANGAAGDDFDHTGANGAIYMSTVNTAVFDNINITGTTADNGITGINVSNFQLNNSLIENAGNGTHESGIEFTNLSGTSSLTNTAITFSETNSLDIVNTDVNLNLTLNNVVFSDTQSSANGEGGFQFRSFSVAGPVPTTNIDILDSDFLRLRTQAIQVIGEDDSLVTVDITNNNIDSGTGIGAGIDINGNDTSTVNFNIIGNTAIRSSGGAAINISSFANANVMGRIANNSNITVYSQTPAGTGASGSGVRLLAQESSHLTVAITGNSLTQGAGNNSSAIDVIAREGSARLDLTLTGNVIDSTDVNTLADINIQSGSSSGSNVETNQIYANIANNNLTATAAAYLLRLRVSELDNTHDPRIFLQGFIEAGTAVQDAVATWNANGNTPGAVASPTANIAVSLSGTATGPSAGTAQTPTNPLP